MPDVLPSVRSPPRIISMPFSVAWVGRRQPHTPVRVQPGALGPGRLLEQALAHQGQIIATIMCGDGYFADHEEAVVEQVQAQWQTPKPDVFIAGPAFRAGRYGLACGRLCLEAERQHIPAVTGMHVENPGSDLYRPEHLYIIATEASAVGMRPALERMAALAIKRGRRQPIGTATEEGFCLVRCVAPCIRVRQRPYGPWIWP